MIPVLNARDLPRRGRHPVLPEGAVLVDRHTKWGNPYRIGDTVPELDVERFRMNERPMTRSDVLDLYRAATNLKLLAEPGLFDELLTATALVCHCDPEPCHALFIAEHLEARRKELNR